MAGNNLTHRTPSVARSGWQRLIDVATPLFKRDIFARYRGSGMGLAWTFLVPLLMLGVYTFIFGRVFPARWSEGVEPKGLLDFALILFIGLITHSFATEVLTRAPTIILGQVNLVKRVVFPLQILPVMCVVTALFQYTVSLLVFLAFQLVATGTVSLGILWLPVIIAPFTLLLVGGAWLLAGANVYLRDIAQLMGVTSTVLLFMSPVFYPVSRLPERLWPVFMLNPLTFIIEQSRRVVFTAALPDFAGLALYSIIAIAVAFAGFAAFQGMRRSFADVL
ncbi:ABC transporter permease [Devosia naphthalenivorans]|uniref:ABC transporter permease n=1 Tax=Devosia naphthalenivorans TaxID=2082392 RepID=UPI0019624B18|nr:ABC transporter permease [Devosia naphthalenivorans]